MPATQHTCLRLPADEIASGVLVYRTSSPDDFEANYLQVREQEGRILPDQAVAALPQTPEDDRHHREWQIRSRSFDKLRDHLMSEGPQSRTVLDLGCGNGWLSGRLAEAGRDSILGVDVNLAELRQARRVFTSDQLSFCYADIFAPVFESDCFDIIIIGSALQYFPDLPRLVDRCLQLCRKGAEIHLLDSPLYTRETVAEARRRSDEYYAQLESNSMAKHYFHHCREDLEKYAVRFQYEPMSERVDQHDSPFPWVIISA